LRNALRQLVCTYTDDVGPEHETDDERNQRELSRQALGALQQLIVGAADQHRRLVYGADWRVKLRTPELSMPLKCPSLEESNVRRWREQWNRFAHLDLADSDLQVPDGKHSQANKYNAALTRGRLAGFHSLTEARGEFPPGTDLARIIQQDLQQAIQARYPHNIEVERQDDLQKEIDQQEQFLSINSEGFIERAGDFDELNDYVANESTRLFLLTAPGGMGKTMLLANWVDRYRTSIEANPDRSIHFRFIGASDRSTTIYSLLRFLLREMKQIAGKFDKEIPDDPIELRQAWLESLSAVGKRGKTVIVIDALNQLETGLTDMGWLCQTLPENIKLIVSFKRDDQASEALYQRLKGAQAILSEVKPFRRHGHRRRLVKAFHRKLLFLKRPLKRSNDRLR